MDAARRHVWMSWARRVGAERIGVETFPDSWNLHVKQTKRRAKGASGGEVALNGFPFFNERHVGSACVSGKKKKPSPHSQPSLGQVHSGRKRRVSLAPENNLTDFWAPSSHSSTSAEICSPVCRVPQSAPAL